MAYPRNYRIGVLADTHNRWLPRVAELLKGADEIWHLGDVCQEKVLDELRALGPQLSVVLGNNDTGLDYPLTQDPKRCGERFHLVHIPPRRMPPDADWLLYGHTHKPMDEMHLGIHLFNPGSAGLANKGAPLSMGFLIREAGKPFRCEKVLL